MPPPRPAARSLLPEALLAASLPVAVAALLAATLPPGVARQGAVVLAGGAAAALSARLLSARLGRRADAAAAEILERLPDGVLLCGGGRTAANGEARRILGSEGERHPAVAAFLERARREGRAGPEEIALPGPGGVREVRLAAAAAGPGGAELVVTLRDVTEERGKALLRGDFAATASHELRKPLANVRGYLEAMADARRNGEEPDPFFLDVAIRNALRMEGIIDDLLELARAESPRGPATREEIAPRPFLEEVAALHGDEARRRGKRVEVEGGEEPFPGDRRKMTLAVGNLLENALRHGREGGTVRLSGAVEGGEAVLSVSDDGPGIEAEHLPRLFERFYRVDRGRSRDPGGTGLGLSIVKHLVESQGGTVSAESEAGRGSTFTVRLPLRPPR